VSEPVWGNSVLAMLVFLVFNNLIGLLIFLFDRQAAHQGRQRVNPMLLYLSVLLGGGLGGLLARAPMPGVYRAPPLDQTLIGIMGIEAGVAAGLALTMLPVA
jgi:uncharacterized membrane protein YsdA (DUF1294 family)